MKKSYIVPDLELHKVSLVDAILSSPTEGVIPSEGNLDPVLPGDDTELDDLF